MQNDTVDTLNGFLRGEISAVETYRLALTKLSNFMARSELEDCRRSHERRVEQLREQVRELGGTPAEGSGAWGGFTRLVEGGAKLFGEKAAIAALEQGEDYGLDLYRKNVDKLDYGARAIVERDLLPAQQQTHQMLSALKHGIH